MHFAHLAPLKHFAIILSFRAFVPKTGRFRVLPDQASFLFGFCSFPFSVSFFASPTRRQSGKAQTKDGTASRDGTPSTTALRPEHARHTSHGRRPNRYTPHGAPHAQCFNAQEVGATHAANAKPDCTRDMASLQPTQPSRPSRTCETRRTPPRAHATPHRYTTQRYTSRLVHLPHTQHA